VLVVACPLEARPGRLANEKPFLQQAWRSHRAYLLPGALAGAAAVAGGVLLRLDGQLHYRANVRETLGLEAAGQSDVELVAFAWRRWRHELVHHITGDFAVCALDGNGIWACVDAVASHPLYFAQADGGLVIASCLPDLLDTGLVAPAVDPSSLGVMLLAGLPRGATAFRSVKMLCGGGELSWTPKSGLTIGKWWRPRAVRATKLVTAESAAEVIRPIFAAAVAERLPVGPAAFTLSGGLDSTLSCGFAATARAGIGSDIHTFTSVCHPRLAESRDWSQGKWEADDWPYAQVMREMYPAITQHRVHGGEPCLLDDFALINEKCLTPIRNVANVQWISKAARAAAELGAPSLMGGYLGNFTVSFGDHRTAVADAIAGGCLVSAIRSLPGPPTRSMKVLLRALPDVMWPNWARRRATRRFLSNEPLERDAIRGEVWDSLTRWLGSAELTPGAARFSPALRSAFAPDLRLIGGVGLSDPTADRRVLDALYALPLTAFVTPTHTRALARHLGAGVVPDVIRWRTTRGRQSPEEPGYFGLYEARYRQVWPEVVSAGIDRFVDPQAAHALLERLIRGEGTLLQAQFMHRLFNIGLFLDHVRDRFGAGAVEFEW
jgi:asparagine synthase (glutamine-hydrolysing)